jgi:hypothetical protein
LARRFVPLCQRRLVRRRVTVLFDDLALHSVFRIVASGKVEVRSEAKEYPVEFALVLGEERCWRAADSGTQPFG